MTGLLIFAEELSILRVLTGIQAVRATSGGIQEMCCRWTGISHWFNWDSRHNVAFGGSNTSPIQVNPGEL